MTPPADVIIVLGAAQAAGGVPGPVIERRVRHGVGLFEAGRAPRLLLSGGPTRYAEAEADSMAAVALAAGVPDAALIRETRSDRTFTNAVECRDILCDRGWTRAILVTDHFHMPRALMSFRGLGVAVDPDPVHVPFSAYVAAAHLREFVARQLYSRMIRAYKERKQEGQLGGA